MEAQPITIRKNGKWYYGQAEMFRRNILNILASHIKRDDKGNYYIEMGEERNPLIVEDVPFYAIGITEEAGKIKLVFHDLQEMLLDKEMKIIFKGDVPYITFKWEGDTRLSRGVYWKLSDYFDFRGEDVYIVPPGLNKC
ncbi:hypothetical protein SAMN02745221_00992 [Thermosyntropha lipolytica DSM 11003]|uniref:DUF1285 domain-containing protein n=1 Tax=Thermosyntropha lipolytica DSM 11003 TaxID=1123382 RepID=A0A1M5MRK5_9FIRM|nr:DUF1285 domain-containing protein [Thermosyntropha lipolytica]SHG80014.1 hypothetical protein SAMN02745221_00992 [Thermosyntropha lipolytica DSM 11003]